MASDTFARAVRGWLLLAAALTVSIPAPARAQSEPGDKLDRVLQVRARPLTGRSRVNWNTNSGEGRAPGREGGGRTIGGTWR